MNAHTTVTAADRRRAPAAIGAETTDQVVAALGGRLLTIAEVVAWTGKHRATIYRWIASGTFPAGKNAGAGTRLWSRSEVQEWLDRRD